MNSSVLITGVGAIIGQGIIRSLVDAKTGFRLVSIDINPSSVGFKWTDSYYTVPRVNDPAWVGCITEICKKENVALILPGIEQDLKALIEHREVIMATGAFPLINSMEALKVGLDKWELYIFARKLGVKMPKTWLVEENDFALIPNSLYPLILKPRRGMAAKGIYKLKNKVALECQLKIVEKSGYMIQQFVGSDDEEYTVSVFGFCDGSISLPFMLRRKLKYGSTFEAKTIEDAGLSETVSRLATELKVVGPTNFQFRKVGKDFLLLEINPRFSSSTSIKSAFGFNEPLMAIKSFILKEPPKPLVFKKGMCSRYIVDDVTYT